MNELVLCCICHQEMNVHVEELKSLLVSEVVFWRVDVGYYRSQSLMSKNELDI